jgi:hypothetical protein
MVLYLLALVFYYLHPFICLFCSIVASTIIIGEMTLSYDVIDLFFPKKKSQNVISKISAKEISIGKPKKLLIIGGHIDSNYEFPLMKKLGHKFGAVIGLNFMLNALMSAFLMIRIVFILLDKEIHLSFFTNLFFWIFVIGSPIAVIQLFFIISNIPVMGANDNLSAVAVCYELIQYLSNDEHRPKNLEVWIAQYGCEEIGSKGSRAFIKRHYDEIKDALAINIDMIGNRNNLQLATSELMGLIPLSKDLIRDLTNTARQLNISIKAASDMGFTDSLSFARKGIKATSIVSVPPSNDDFYYHTRNDVIEHVNFENLVDCLSILKEFIKELDDKKEER